MKVLTMRDDVINTELLPLYRWIGVAIVAALLLWLGWRAGLHHLVIAVLVSVVVLFIAIALFELAWRVVVSALRRLGLQIDR